MYIIKALPRSVHVGSKSNESSLISTKIILIIYVDESLYKHIPYRVVIECNFNVLPNFGLIYDNNIICNSLSLLVVITQQETIWTDLVNNYLDHIDLESLSNI